MKVYAILVAVCIVAGSAVKVDLIWNMADCFNSAMVIPNIIGLFALSKVVKEVHKDYFNNFKPKQKKSSQHFSMKEVEKPTSSKVKKK